MKRARVSSSGDTLTGGTKDVNPQYISAFLSTTAGSPTAAVETIINSPIVHVGPATNNTAIIIECLKLWVDLPPPATTDINAALTQRSAFFSFTTASRNVAGTVTVAQISDAHCLAAVGRDTYNSFTAAGTGIEFADTDPRCWDFTDGAGHGVLFASDNLNFQFQTVGYAGAATVNFKLMYRFKKVSLVEYIGIVQSQQ